MTDALSEYSRIAVLDIGKTNAKVVLLDSATGTEICVLKAPNVVLTGPPYPHYDVEALWQFALDAFVSLAASHGFEAISITTHGASAALIDADGNLAMPVLDYEHLYPDAITTAYDEIRPPFETTFSPRLSGGLNLGSQLHYQKTAFPEQFAKVRTIMTYPQYWAWRLTGIVANEVTSLGCHTDLWDPRHQTYSPLVDMLGIRDRMALLRSAFDALGRVTPEIASRIGISVPVFCGIHDSNASLLSHLVDGRSPFAVVSTGTWVVNFAVGGDLDHLDPDRDTLANVDAYGRAVPSSRFMGGREFELLTAELGPLDAQKAAKAIPEVIAGKMMLLPNIAAGSGPYPGLQRQWLNGDGASADCRWAAACLYLALMTETCLDLIGARGPVLVEGPFSANSAYLSALQALLQRDVVAVPGATGTSQGAALLAGAKPQRRRSQPVAIADIGDLGGYRQLWRQKIS